MNSNEIKSLIYQDYQAFEDFKDCESFMENILMISPDCNKNELRKIYHLLKDKSEKSETADIRSLINQWFRVFEKYTQGKSPSPEKEYISKMNHY